MMDHKGLMKIWLWGQLMVKAKEDQYHKERLIIKMKMRKNKCQRKH